MASDSDSNSFANSLGSREVIRREVRRRRRALSVQQQRQAAADLRRLLARQPLFQRSRHIAFYLPNDGEIDPRPLMQLAMRLGKYCYLPLLHPAREGRLWFLRYRASDKLKPNRFNIPEPVLGRSARRHARALDLVLLPLVAFDQGGGRLGMGAGFYDRTFAFKLEEGRSRHTPALIGLAHRCQQVPALPLAEWDVALAAIGTDGGIVDCRGAGAGAFLQTDVVGSRSENRRHLGADSGLTG